MHRALITLAALTGCANYAVVDTWKGRTADDLAVAWGSPTAIQRLDDGRRVMNYEHSTLYQGASYPCRAWFVADRQGTIIETNVQGTNGGCRGLLDGKRAGR